MALQHSSASRMAPPPLPEDTPWTWGMPMWTWWAGVVIGLYLTLLGAALPGIFVISWLVGEGLLWSGLLFGGFIGAFALFAGVGSLVELSRARRPSLLLAGGRRGPASLPRAPRAVARRALLFGVLGGAVTAGAVFFALVPVVPLILAVLSTTPGKPRFWHPKPQRR